jgi:hypothetical protein
MQFDRAIGFEPMAMWFKSPLKGLILAQLDDIK